MGRYGTSDYDGLVNDRAKIAKEQLDRDDVCEALEVRYAQLFRMKRNPAFPQPSFTSSEGTDWWAPKDIEAFREVMDQARDKGRLVPECFFIKRSDGE